MSPIWPNCHAAAGKRPLWSFDTRRVRVRRLQGATRNPRSTESLRMRSPIRRVVPSEITCIIPGLGELRTIWIVSVRGDGDDPDGGTGAHLEGRGGRHERRGDVMPPDGGRDRDGAARLASPEGHQGPLLAVDLEADLSGRGRLGELHGGDQ